MTISKWYRTVISWLVMSICSSNVMSQDKALCLDIGNIAVDDRLCDAIDWKTSNRTLIKNEMKKMIAALGSDLMSINTLESDAFKEYVKKVGGTIDMEAIEKAAIGLYLTKKSFAFSHPLMKSYVSANQDTVLKIQESLSEAEKLMSLELDKLINDDTYIDITKMTSTIDRLVIKYIGITKDRVTAILDVSGKDKLKNLEKLMPLNKDIDCCVDIKRRAIFYVASKLADKNRFIGKQPILIPPSLLVLANLEVVNKQLGIASLEKEKLTKLFSYFIDYYNDTKKIYIGLETNDRNELMKAHAFYSRLLNEEADALDSKLPQILGAKYARLMEIQHQYKGPASLLSQVVANNDEYMISSDQLNQMSKLRNKGIEQQIAKLKSMTPKEDRLPMQSQFIQWLNKEAYSKLLNDEQKKLWDKKAGVLLSDTDWLEMHLELLRLNSGLSK